MRLLDKDIQKNFYAVYRSNTRGRAYLFIRSSVQKKRSNDKSPIKILSLKTTLPLVNGQYVYIKGLQKNNYFNVYHFSKIDFPKRYSEKKSSISA